LLNDPDMDSLALDIYNHSLFNANGSGLASNEKELDSKPDYVPPRQFAMALVDILQSNAIRPGDVTSAIQCLPDAQLRQALHGMYQRVAGDLTQFEARIAGWYDCAMQHVSGVYKRTMQLWTVLLGLAIAVSMNIDALHLYKVLWVHPALIQGLSSDRLANAHAAWNQLSVTDLPIGWDSPPVYYQSGKLGLNYPREELLMMAAGWLITALSTLFGASFWFDLLQKVTNIRGAGRNAASG
jgi:hypothetical protein